MVETTKNTPSYASVKKSLKKAKARLERRRAKRIPECFAGSPSADKTFGGRVTSVLLFPVAMLVVWAIAFVIHLWM